MKTTLEKLLQSVLSLYSWTPICSFTLFDSLRKLSDGLHGGQVEATRVNVRIQGLPSNVLRSLLALLHVPTSHDDATPWRLWEWERGVRHREIRSRVAACLRQSERCHIFSTPLLASSRAVAFPIPVLAPVMTTVFPLMVALLGHRPPVTWFLHE